MKKLFKNLIVVLTLTMLFGTTCFAEEKSPQIYVDDCTIPEFAALYTQKNEEKKATSPAGTYDYQCYTFSNSVVCVESQISNNMYSTIVTSIIFDTVFDQAIVNINASINGVPVNDSATYPMNIEVR